MGNCVFSFDVFDTVLTRNVYGPKAVFHLVQSRLPNSITGVDGSLTQSYYSARIWSEFRARRRSVRDDVRLGEIYEVLAERFNLNGDQRSLLMDLELTAEQDSLIAINGAPEHVARRRSQGQVVFISDMYLPHDFIVSILEQSGLFMPGDRLYVSGEYGLTKGSGKLFAKVLEDFAISAGQLVHLGDNPVSDFAVPVRMGINFDDTLGMPLAAGSKWQRWRQRSQYLLELLHARWQLG